MQNMMIGVSQEVHWSALVLKLCSRMSKVA